MKIRFLSEFVETMPEDLEAVLGGSLLIDPKIMQEELYYNYDIDGYFNAISSYVKNDSIPSKGGADLPIYLLDGAFSPETVLFEFTKEEYLELEKYQLIGW